MIRKDGWVKECVKAKSMAQARKGNGLERHMARIIDGKMPIDEYHSTIPEDCGEETLAAFITSGMEIERYIFGKFGRPHVEYRVSEDRIGKRNASLLPWVREWK